MNSENNQIAIIENKEQFIQKFEPRQMIKSFANIKTAKQAIEADKNAISFYKKQFGETTVSILIKMHIASLNASLNVHSKLNELQIDEIADEIMCDYFYLSPVEIGFIFRQAKKGGFGRIDYALNMPSVLSWFESYATTRTNHFINKQIDNHSNYKQIDERSSTKEIEKTREAVKQYRTEQLKNQKND